MQATLWLTGCCVHERLARDDVGPESERRLLRERLSHQAVTWSRMGHSPRGLLTGALEHGKAPDTASGVATWRSAHLYHRQDARAKQACRTHVQTNWTALSNFLPPSSLCAL